MQFNPPRAHPGGVAQTEYFKPENLLAAVTATGYMCIIVHDSRKMLTKHTVQ
jgi:hypothetical protein